MFSIIIPLYNKEKYIKETIKSVLNQSVQGFEIIVVDDGSQDDGLKIVKNIDDDRIKIIKQKNKGVSVARNNGIRNAKYEYIAFLDADDLWEEDFLESISELIKLYPNAGAYGTDYKLVDIKSKIEKVKSGYAYTEKYIITDNYFREACNNMHLTASSTVVRKDVFEKVGYFPEGVSTWEDVDMWCRIGICYSIAFINKKKVIYNQNVDGSNTKVAKWMESPFFNNYNEYIEKYNVKEEKLFYLKEYVYRHHIQNCLVFNKFNRNLKVSIKILWENKGTRIYRKYWCKALVTTFTPRAMHKYIFKVR
ncbi:glycosyltransferase family 2 protein [Clostridium disporicum]|uniref:glycosyltransferase family 2 protein n=1 Tax=Clostridium disporicum TaxID=84024 RepID=UPI003615021B